MEISVVDYRPLSEFDLCAARTSPRRVSRRGLLKGLAVLPVGAAVGYDPQAALAQGGILAYVTFASALIDFASKAYEAYSKVVVHPEVINSADEEENRSLLGTVRNQRGLVVHQGYTVIFVPPRHSAIVQVVVDAGDDPGYNRLIVQSRIDEASGHFRVVA